jgi:NagD protein
MFYRARKKLSEGLHSQLGETVMIGDTMATDIRGAIEIGLQAFLVMTGSTRLEEVGDYVYQPTRVLQSIADLVDEIRLGQVSDRLNSPAFGVSPTARAKPGSRHQTDIYALYRPRPRPAMTK